MDLDKIEQDIDNMKITVSNLQEIIDSYGPTLDNMNAELGLLKKAVDQHKPNPITS